ncbi:hypothetical protein AKJ55_00835 [candidate division MSBL1 archaeon SCGC-AAA382M17]|uniref:A-type ATP synthase subunit E n=1 Tax=candidate division MSBL1 archaeon SCGC-AAA382M17 TaxID=1698284 RepID=A0ABR5TJQ9_9EURY|nr:hypothetical protein AKJ55_00835 [candidate division MSBL1 archaeon SCGC-AAA382M17]
MNGLQKMIRQIKEKAEKERKSILEKAEAEADKKISRAEEKAENEKEKIMEKGRSEAEKEKQRILASARSKKRQEKLKAREEIIQETFEKAKDELSKLRKSDDYPEILKDLIIEGGKSIGGKDLKVLMSEKDKNLISEKSKSEMEEKISEKTGEETSIEMDFTLTEINGGAIIQRKNGNIACDNTLEARLERQKDSLRKEVAQILF